MIKATIQVYKYTYVNHHSNENIQIGSQNSGKEQHNNKKIELWFLFFISVLL